MNVIIGAGPAGLYTAIRLRHEGVANVVVFDPRAGIYTRPGHLNRNAFTIAEAGIKKSFELGAGRLHIKELERHLFAEAKRLGIRIENKKFIRLHADRSSPGVFVSDAAGVEEFIPADFVFDCTGQKRLVVHAVNELMPAAPPFHLETITELPVPNHFIAYVKMKAEHASVSDTLSTFDVVFPYLSRLDYAKALLQFRAFGWTEFRYPRYYSVSFGKEKECMYLQAPPGLTVERYDLWVNTVLNSSGIVIPYQRMPESRKYKDKPRFGAFTMGARELNRVSFKGKDLPHVIALGDAQIDFDYILAHGIADGLERIDVLIAHMEFLEGVIAYFDADDYLLSIKSQLVKHKRQMIAQADRVKTQFEEIITPAISKLSDALKSTSDASLQVQINLLLSEAKARHSYLNARDKFYIYHHESGMLKDTFNTTIPIAYEQLSVVHTELMHAQSVLPSAFSKEHAHIAQLLQKLTYSFKKIADNLYRSNVLAVAVSAYQKASELYLHSRLTDTTLLIKIYSNLVIILNKQKRYPEAIIAAHKALELQKINPSELSAELKEKIVYNGIKSYVLQGHGAFLEKNLETTRTNYLRALALLTEHHTVLTAEHYSLLSASVDELKTHLDTLSAELIPISSLGGGSSASPRSIGSSVTAVELTDELSTVLKPAPKDAITPSKPDKFGEAIEASAPYSSRKTTKTVRMPPLSMVELLSNIGLFACVALNATGIGVGGLYSPFIKR